MPYLSLGGSPEFPECVSVKRWPGSVRNTFSYFLLDLKSKELIVIVSSVLMRCQFCVEVRSQRVIAQGVSKKEITEAIAVAMFIAGGSRLDKHLL